MGRSGRVAIVGGGPAGLFLARMVGLTQPKMTVEVYERNGPDDAFGFGVTLSDRTMHGISVHDPQTHRRIIQSSMPLSGVELRLPDATLRYHGFGVRSISRHTLLALLREQAEEVGAGLHFRHEVSAGDLDADILAFADGATSGHRTARREGFGTRIQTGAARYIWLGTSAGFDDITAFAFVRTEYGPMAAHSYPYAEGMSTVVVETDDVTWRHAGLDASVLSTPVPGEIDGKALSLLSGIFADHLGGHALVSNKSKWGTFNVVHNEHWSHGNEVLLGDAAHTAHFTVGSGTKMALEDGMALASALREYDDRATAFAEYERRRRGPVTRTQRAAEPSMRWWETYGRRLHLPPAQFGMHFITRTGALSYLGLRRRCPDRIDDAEAAYHREAGVEPGQPSRNAVGAGLRLGPVRLPNRLVTVLPQAPDQPIPGGAGLVLLRGDAPAGVPAPGGSVIGRLRPDGWEPSADADRTGGLQIVELPCPDDPEWTEAGDDLVRRAGLLRKRGAAGVLLRTGTVGESTWDRSLGYASRIRTEAGIAVAVCVPGDWALDLARSAEVDPWPTRIHMALVSGRIDLVVAAGP